MDTKSLPSGCDDGYDAHVIDLIYEEEDQAELAWLSNYVEFPAYINPDDPFKTNIKEGDGVVFLKGLGFHSIDEEIVEFFPRRKVVTSSTSVEIIKQVDIYKYDPWHLPSSGQDSDLWISNLSAYARK